MDVIFVESKKDKPTTISGFHFKKILKLIRYQLEIIKRVTAVHWCEVAVYLLDCSYEDHGITIPHWLQSKTILKLVKLGKSYVDQIESEWCNLSSSVMFERAV